MFLNPQILTNMVTSVTAELEKLFKEFQVEEQVIAEVNSGITELLRSKSTSPNYTLRIDRWPVGELQKVFDRNHFGSADFGAKTWIEIVANFADEKVTIKRSATQKDPSVLYNRPRKEELAPTG